MSINRIGLYHLETLLWIERLGTFAAAAERLNTTQPAVSARVREMEGHLGAALFRREGRANSLTPAGRQLVRELTPLWAEMQKSLLGCGDFAGATGVVRLGAGEIAAASCLPYFVSQLKAEMPGVSLEIEIDLTANLIQQLLAGRTDIVFAAGPVAHPALKAYPIGEVALLWLARADVAATFRQDGMDAIPIWSLASHSPIHGRMREAIAASSAGHRSLNLCNNARLMIDIAVAGGGVGIFPEPMVRRERESGRLVELEGLPALEPIQFHVAKRASDSEPLISRIVGQASALRLDQWE